VKYLVSISVHSGYAGLRREVAMMGTNIAIARPSAAMQMVSSVSMSPMDALQLPQLTGSRVISRWSFDPSSGKPNYPIPAFLMMDRGMILGPPEGGIYRRGIGNRRNRRVQRSARGRLRSRK